MASPIELRRFVGGGGNPGDLSRILKAVGEMAVSDAQRHFDDQEFNGRPWKRRYPNQSPYTINVAGALADLSTSGNIKARRFSDRPAGIDTGELRNSIASRKVKSDTVEVGSTVPYAATVNFGGFSTQPVTPQAKRNLARFLKKKSNKRFGEFIGFLFKRDELRTRVTARKFIGVTPQLEKDIAELVELVIEGRV